MYPENSFSSPSGPRLDEKVKWALSSQDNKGQMFLMPNHVGKTDKFKIVIKKS